MEHSPHVDTSKITDEVKAQNPVGLGIRSRIYGNRVAGGSFVFADGSSCLFYKGWFETSDPVQISQLDAILGKQPLIFKPDHEDAIVTKLEEVRKRGGSGTIAQIVNAAMAEQVLMGTADNTMTAVQQITNPDANKMLEEAARNQGNQALQSDDALAAAIQRAKNARQSNSK